MYHSGGKLGNQRVYTCVKTGGTWEKSVYSTQFSCDPKT